ncbi:epidermis-specific secreted glycoprotein EP1-like [Pyrus ussuriensis x Pyrus communis]|uniref:Epidermis-specific secreted glycoprotein EP1-like n=1 Tax=Pyrus ussuriensis x Pyrus communis TaxID=2448454 RepID=A0A5N5GLH6_9ROSA|nr:epidermis-specific secreted glycoprotein EP1-like [Pyrus ussuriensis x Pyrus communis]
MQAIVGLLPLPPASNLLLQQHPKCLHSCSSYGFQTFGGILPVGLGIQSEKPVGENAILTFGTNGNLVLAHANGKVAWQTNTADKGVVGFKLLPNGNM